MRVNLYSSIFAEFIELNKSKICGLVVSQNPDVEIPISITMERFWTVLIVIFFRSKGVPPCDFCVPCGQTRAKNLTNKTRKITKTEDFLLLLNGGD